MRLGAGGWGLGVILGFLLNGCTSSPTPKLPNSQTPLQVWGSRGRNAGDFYEPRAIAIAPNGFAWLVDSSGRIQKWTTDGKFMRAWQAPSIEKGRPEGVAILKDGNIAVTDTHYSRVLIYSPQGKLLRKFGSYGKKPGQFLLVTGILVDADGNIFTADYGGDFDRIQKWTPAGVLIAS